MRIRDVSIDIIRIQRAHVLMACEARCPTWQPARDAHIRSKRLERLNATAPHPTCLDVLITRFRCVLLMERRLELQ